MNKSHHFWNGDNDWLADLAYTNKNAFRGSDPTRSAVLLKAKQILLATRKDQISPEQFNALCKESRVDINYLNDI